MYSISYDFDIPDPCLFLCSPFCTIISCYEPCYINVFLRSKRHCILCFWVWSDAAVFHHLSGWIPQGIKFIWKLIYMSPVILLCDTEGCSCFLAYKQIQYSTYVFPLCFSNQRTTMIKLIIANFENIFFKHSEH